MVKKKALNIFSDKLPRGARKKLAEEFGVTPTYITLIFTGKRRNVLIINRAIEMAEEYRKMDERAEELFTAFEREQFQAGSDE